MGIGGTMNIGLLGKKEGMTQVFSESGDLSPVTVVRAGPCQVIQVKDEKKDGYNALQLGFEEKKEKSTKKQQRGHFKKAGTTPRRYLKEFPYSEENPVQKGDTLTVGIFKDVQTVDVSGTSKGKGFAGTIKRWNFTRGPASHGSMNVRRPGSIGHASNPSRVFKGKKMAGRMGGKQVTVKNLRIIKVDEENNLLFIKGAVPGPTHGVLLIRAAKTFRPKAQDKEGENKEEKKK